MFELINKETTYGMSILVIATTLCNNYDKWKNNNKLINIVDIDTNSICIELKRLYPGIENKVTQCIALSFPLYFYLLFTQAIMNYNIEKCNEQNLLNDNNQFDQLDHLEHLN